MTDQLLGLLRVRVQRGVNLVVRDFTSSDPYLVLRMGNQNNREKLVRRSDGLRWGSPCRLFYSVNAASSHSAAREESGRRWRRERLRDRRWRAHAGVAQGAGAAGCEPRRTGLA
ncbi:hypothetical protein B296_00051340 [Ensete ventricosum]|uniref:C2 domain-containing protein n=1 Tax=Ensete ventricosum TaxID=4639 RepID=A0A426Y1D8_ENSVE|nr:hypothetical protein B296_00051340 [Ensete ventricosum]